MKVSFIIVNYNVTALLRNCLNSIVRFADVPHEIIVIDNNSPDDSWRQLQAEFPAVKFFANEKNEGFSKANNKAAAKAQGDFLYFLNPDTELKDFYLAELIDFAESTPNFGCLGLRMHDKDGKFLPESKRSVPDLVYSFKKLFLNSKGKKSQKNYYRNDIPLTAIAEVEVITGANLLVQCTVFHEVGGFDEAYFMYGEDIDLCYTLILNGYRNFYYGKHELLHYKGQSTEKNQKYLDRFYGAMAIFVNKYYRKNPLEFLVMSAGLRIRKLYDMLVIRLH
ncbi:glycosyltransferase family 2 protein [Cruoricaptor ignavus]|uniref:glycosyltransferase family 2 protein n=1 Tax=Cruoricaptor ignavus TaxID=1118202 RepID=UPI00370D5ACF